MQITSQNDPSTIHDSVREHLDKPQTDATHYDHSYDTKARLASYWHQIDEVLRFQPRTVLEVGIGSGFTTSSLRREGIDVTTLDVAEDLNPTIVGSVRSIPMSDNCIDIALCCQVLEHLPFSEFANAFSELYRVATKGVIISLPDQERCLRVSVRTELHVFKHGIRDFPRHPKHRPKNIGVQHYWEIGCYDIGLADVLQKINQVTGKPPRTYRVFENPYHRFFVASKLSDQT